jgi:hypothetical protein
MSGIDPIFYEYVRIWQRAFVELLDFDPAYAARMAAFWKPLVEDPMNMFAHEGPFEYFVPLISRNIPKKLLPEKCKYWKLDDELCAVLYGPHDVTAVFCDTFSWSDAAARLGAYLANHGLTFVAFHKQIDPNKFYFAMQNERRCDREGHQAD